MDLPQEIVERICALLPCIADQLTFLSLNRHYKRLRDYGVITELIGDGRVSDEIIRRPMFQNLRVLRFCKKSTIQITSVNHLLWLEELDAFDSECGISQEGIMQCIRLRKLNVHNNRRITSVNHLPELEELDASGEYCGISQEGIMGCLKLKRLFSVDNPRITSFAHLPKFKRGRTRENR